MTDNDSRTIRIDADTSGVEAAFAAIARDADSFAESFAASMRRAALAGRDLDDALRAVALRLSNLALDRALQPVDGLIGSLLSGGIGGGKVSAWGSAVSAAGKSSTQLGQGLARLISAGASRK